MHVNLLKKFDVAEESYERALDVNPSNAFAWLLKGTLHAFNANYSQCWANISSTIFNYLNVNSQMNCF